VFGPYPFSAAGGIVDDTSLIGFALENQTRPIYAKGFFSDPLQADSVVVHELAHQWYGDSLAVAAWQHIWLNEGFATYAEWLWSEREGLGTVQEIFDFYYGVIPPDDPFWALVIGDPGPDHLFDFPVYARGAMTLHQLRLAVGDDDFFQILRTWAQSRSGENVTTDEFIQLAEQISRQDLDDLFETWLFTPGQPTLATATASATASATAARGSAAGTAHLESLLRRAETRR
jgi:aminopeptidase N